MEFQDLKPQNLQLHCRTCLDKFLEIKHAVEDMPPSILQVFKNFTGYKKKQKDLYPDSVCGNCYEKLKIIDEFQELSKKSTKLLNELFRSFNAKPKSISNELNELDEKAVSLTRPEVHINLQNTSDEDPLLYNQFEEIIVKEEEKEIDISFRASENPKVEELNDSGLCIDKKQESDSNQKLAHDITSASLVNVENPTHKEKQQFECRICDRIFCKKFRLKNHMTEVHGENPVKIDCKFGCGKTFQSLQTANNHYRKHHDVSNTSFKHERSFEKEEIASECLQSPEKAERIRLKKKINEKLEKLGHPIIGRSQIKKENENEILPTSKTTCTICSKSFCSASGLNVHMRIHLDERPFKCDKCDRGFNKRVLLNNHIAEIHTDVPLEILCKYGCGKVFHRQHSAMNHYRLKHILPEKGLKPNSHPRVCEDCGKVCKNISILKEHRFQHIPLEECPYQCEQCSKRFRSKKNLVEHLKRHAGIKNFECPECGLKKTTRRELRLHMNFHTKEMQVQCPICSKLFNSPANMKKHEQVVHQGIKKYSCSYCELSFGKPDTLKHHEMRHTGERPHKCQICERRFIQLVALQAHMKTHNKALKLIETAKINVLDVNESSDVLNVCKKFL